MHKKLLCIFLFLFTLLPIHSWAENYKSVLIGNESIEEIAHNQAPEELKETYFLKQLEDNKIHNIDDYLVWLKNNFKYVSDQKPEWTDWPMTLIKKYGDCEDLSTLNSKVLEHFGFKPIMLGFKNSDYGHVFTIFEKDGYLNIIDNTDYIKTQITNLDQIAAFIYKKYNVDSLFEVKVSSKSVTTLYTKSMLQRIALMQI